MGEVIGELVPIAVAVAISPMHLLAVTVMLLASGGHRVAGAFVAGRTAGTAVLVVLFSVVIGPVEYAIPLPGHVTAVGKIVIGAATVALAAGQWLRHAGRDTEPRTPKWLTEVGSFSTPKAFGLGGLVSIASAKNLALCLAGGVVIRSVPLQVWQITVAIVIFTVLGSAALTTMMVVARVGGTRIRSALENWRDWLLRHQVRVLSVVLLVVGIIISAMGAAELATV